MANNSSKNNVFDTSSSWNSFKMPAGGTASDIRKSVAELRNTAFQEQKVFNGAFILQSAGKNKR